MNKDEILEKILEALNSAVKADRTAVRQLIERRVPVSGAIEGAEVMAVPQRGPQGQLELGALGLINGLCIALTDERVAAYYNPAGTLLHFTVWRPTPPSTSVAP